MKSRLIILSDLWGIKKSDWTKIYFERLNQIFDVRYYDVCELGKIDTTNYQQEILHQQFVQNGIEHAAKQLLTLEKEKLNILAFSIGGVIAWKAALNGLQFENFYAVSSTRLRYETEKPKGNIKLFFGAADIYKPDIDWSRKLNIDCQITKNKNHNLYMEKDFAIAICKEMILDKV